MLHMEIHVFQKIVLFYGDSAQRAFPPEQTCNVFLDNDFVCAWGGYARVQETSTVCVGEVQSFEDTVEAAKGFAQFSICVRVIRDGDIF